MASRFPSLEEFDEGQTSPVLESSVNAASALDFDDPAADFLSREKATLGADADLFATPGDNMAGGAADDLLGQGDDSFGGAFPDLVVGNEAVGPGGTVTGNAEPYLPGQNTYTGMQMGLSDEEEPEVIKQWRDRQALEIQRRDELSESRKRETIEKAQQAIDDFYENYNTKRDRLIEDTRKEAQEFLDQRENTVAGGTAWERIAKLVDLNPKGRDGGSDKTRFREMLLELRKDEKAPGASGF